MEVVEQKLISLSEIEAGRTVRLAAIGGGQSINRRLAAMGMLPDASLEVLSNGHPGPLIVRVRGTRIALGGGVARKIMVR